MDIQTFPSIVVCVLADETVQKLGILALLKPFVQPDTPLSDYIDFILGILKAQNSVPLYIPKL